MITPQQAQHSNRQPPKPRSFNADLSHLPQALAPLLAMRHWLVWKWELTKNKDGTGKWTKVPYQPSGQKAKNNDPSTWSTYDEVMAVVEKWDGIGFCLMGSGLAAFDIDNCRNQETGTIHPWANQKVETVGSYTEITVSGTGLRIIGRCTGGKVHKKFNGVADGVSCEVYRDAERYIVMTGNQVLKSPGHLTNIDQHIDATVVELEAKKTGNRNGNGNGAEQNRPGSPEDGGHHHAQADDGDDIEDLIRNGCGTKYNSDRSAAVWRVINEQLRRGHLPPAIVAMLLDQANKISAHIYDQPKPAQYAQGQVAKAGREIAFTADDQRRPYKKQSNIRIALLKLGVSVRYDQFADRMLLSGLPGFGPTLDDGAVDRLWLTLDQRFHFQPSKDTLLTVLQDTGKLNGFHPVKNYLAELQWDGVERIDRWLTTYAGAEDSEYIRAVGALLLVAAVRRVRKPGCKFDEMLVLEQPLQGTDKSSALAVLAVWEEWFSDDLPLNADSKGVIESIRGRWIVEAAEFNGMRRSNIDHLKALLSRQVDRARLAYGRIVTECPRQCVFVGTTNSREYLPDTTGNRRFWPVRVKRFDLVALQRDRDQLWAEAATREATGCSIRLDEKLWPVAQKEQEQRLTFDPYYEQLQARIGHMEGKIASTDVWEILDQRGGQRTQDQNRRMGEAMRALGFKRPNTGGTIRINGRLILGYARGEQPWKTIEVNRYEGNLTVSYLEDGLP